MLDLELNFVKGARISLIRKRRWGRWQIKFSYAAQHANSSISRERERAGKARQVGECARSSPEICVGAAAAAATVVPAAPPGQRFSYH